MATQVVIGNVIMLIAEMHHLLCVEAKDGGHGKCWNTATTLREMWYV